MTTNALHCIELKLHLASLLDDEVVELEERMRSLLSQLPKCYRNAVSAYYGIGMDPHRGKGIAKFLRLPYAKARVRVQTGCLILRSPMYLRQIAAFIPEEFLPCSLAKPS